MYRVRHVDRHGYRKTPSGNAPSVGLITPRVGIRRGAGCLDYKFVALRDAPGGMHRPPAPGLMADRTALSGGSCWAHADPCRAGVVKVGAPAQTTDTRVAESRGRGAE